MYIHRTIEKELLNLSNDFKVILVTGLRQIGKKKLLKTSSKNKRKYVTLDSGSACEIARNTPEIFFKENKFPLIIDEIQKAPNLFLELKREVDNISENGKVWVIGSQKFSLMKDVPDSLFGRLFEIHLMPFSIYERFSLGLEQKPYIPSERINKVLPALRSDDIWKMIWQGAWPEVIKKSKKQRKQSFDSFFNTLIEKDVQGFSNVDKVSSFKSFIQALAQRTGQELRINKLAASAEVSMATINRWLDIAEACGIIYLLPAFSTNSTKKLTKSPKVYFTDIGFAAYLNGIESVEELRKHPNATAFFETFVVMEILKSWRHNALEPRMYYYRNAKTQAEVDLLIQAEGKLHPIEIKTTNAPNVSMIKHFKELQSVGIPLGFGSVICLTEEPRFLAPGVLAHSILNI